MDSNNNHISTRVDPELKKLGLEFAEKADRLPSWVWAKAIEMGLPRVIKRYAPEPKKKAA